MGITYTLCNSLQCSVDRLILSTKVRPIPVSLHRLQASLKTHTNRHRVAVTTTLQMGLLGLLRVAPCFGKEQTLDCAGSLKYDQILVRTLRIGFNRRIHGINLGLQPFSGCLSPFTVATHRFSTHIDQLEDTFLGNNYRLTGLGCHLGHRNLRHKTLLHMKQGLDQGTSLGQKHSV